MQITAEQMQKAKQAKTAEELLAMAKANGIAMSAEEAAKYFAELNKQGELSDDELDSVAGGTKDPQEYDVEASWASNGCGCGSFKQINSCLKSTCGNCAHFSGIDRYNGPGKCRREFG